MTENIPTVNSQEDRDSEKARFDPLGFLPSHPLSALFLGALLSLMIDNFLFARTPSLTPTNSAVLLSIVGVLLALTTSILTYQNTKKVRDMAETAISETGAYSFASLAEPIRVFISSTSDVFEAEAPNLKEVFRDFPMVKPIFTYETQVIDISKSIRQSDLFILIFGMNYSEHFLAEYRSAAESGKPVFVFQMKGAGWPQKIAHRVMEDVPLEWKEFSSGPELKSEIERSVVRLMLLYYRQANSDRTGGISPLLLPPSNEP